MPVDELVLFVCTIHCESGKLYMYVSSITLSNIRRMKKNVRLDQVRCTGALPHSYALKPGRVNPIKLAYVTCQPDGRPHSDQRL